jgi:cell division protein FtsB
VAPIAGSADALPASRLKFTGRAAILLLVLLVLAVSYASSARAWLKQRSDINTLNAQIAQQRKDVANLQQTERRWHDPAYIKAEARQRFGFVMPGETGYRVIGADGEVLSDGANELSDPTPAETKASPEWWTGIWGSVTEAGKDPADVEEAPAKKPATQIGGKTDKQDSKQNKSAHKTHQ